MKVVIRMTKAQELKALPILLRHSPGTMLPNGIYHISAEAAQTLREAGIAFTLVSRDTDPPGRPNPDSGE